MRKLNLLDDSIKDLAYASRSLRKSPLFALTAVAAIALGIGAGTAIFSVTDAVLLRPLPYRDPARLVLAGTFSNADYFDFRAGTTRVFEDIGGVSVSRAFVPREDGSAEQLSRALITTNFFRLMGAGIGVGRDFSDADAVPQPADPNVLIPPGTAAILGYEYWQRRYGGDKSILGREMVSLGQRGPRIVGVLAPGFRLIATPLSNTGAEPDYWVANNVGYDNTHRNLLTTGAIARLRPGISVERAQEQVDSVVAGLRKSLPTFDRPFRLEPLHRSMVREVRPALLALMGAVVFLLLIACANVANLLLVRGAVRQRELAVRAALGGGRWRLMRQMLVEALLLSATGTLIGILLARFGIRELLAIAPENLPRLDAVAMDWRVLAFAAAAGLGAAAIFGILPAWRAAQPDIAQILRGGGRTARPGAGRGMRNGVVVAEVALSFVLLIGSGLMLRSFIALQRIDPGYDTHGILTFMVTRQWELSRVQGRLELLREIQARLRDLPGVESVTASIALPLSHRPQPMSQTARRDPPGGPSAANANYEQVMPGYFETLRTPLLEGRTFTEEDNAPGRRVAVIDDLLAARAFPGESAVGKRILVPWPNIPWVEVIGVTGHQRTASLADPGRETVYFTDGLAGVGVSRHWAIRTKGDPAALAPAVRAEIARIDKQLVVARMQPMDVLVDRDQAKTRFSLLLIGTFAAIAAILASVGLYGVLASAVRQRTAEIGVRMALGAAPAGIFGLVVGHGLRLGAAGIAIGLVAALALTRVMASMLVGVRATDPTTFAATAIVFLLIAAAASWLPARRAASLDPTEALREE
jgi:putative ABC transport system permease protein